MHQVTDYVLKLNSKEILGQSLAATLNSLEVAATAPTTGYLLVAIANSIEVIKHSVMIAEDFALNQLVVLNCCQKAAACSIRAHFATVVVYSMPMKVRLQTIGSSWVAFNSSFIDIKYFQTFIDLKTRF